MELEVHKIQQLRTQTNRAFDEAERISTQNKQAEDSLLRDYVTYHRKYPEGYEFPYDGDICTLGAAIGMFSDDNQTIEIVYSVSRNGFAIDSLMEKNVDHPDYA